MNVQLDVETGVVFAVGRIADGTWALLGLDRDSGRALFERTDFDSEIGPTMAAAGGAAWIGLEDDTGFLGVRADGEPVGAARVVDARGGQLQLAADASGRMLAALSHRRRGSRWSGTAVLYAASNAQLTEFGRAEIELADWPRDLAVVAKTRSIVIGSSQGTSQIVCIGDPSAEGDTTPTTDGGEDR